MIFSDILNETRNIIDETDEDEQIDVIIKSAINHSYLFDLAPLFPVIQTYYLPAIQGVVELPFESVEILKIEPKLGKDDKKIGKALIVSKDNLYTIKCGVTYQSLQKDSDEILIPDRYTYLLVKYACYMYFEHRKKIEVAQSFLQEYKLGIDKIKYEDNDDCFSEQVVDKNGFFE